MNATRVKFRNLLFSDFKDKVVDMNSSVDQLTRCIVDVESALNSRYNKGDAISQDYRSRFRDIRFNLQKNKRLLGDLLFGELAGEKLAGMTSEEMLSDEIKKEVRSFRLPEVQREQMKEELFEASQTDWYKKHVHISGGFKVRCGEAV